MKVILYMASTINGYIAKENDDTSWISPEEWNSYASAVKKSGCLVVGHRTYEILTKQPEFSDLKDIRVVAVGHGDINLVASNHSVARSPKEALEQLKNYDEVVLAGGGHLNSAFLSENLVNEIYLDIEPKLFGKGIQIFIPADFEKDLKLAGTKQISNNEIQLHYLIR